uniref:Zinc finger and BTB domain containing 7B n=1 Tax=Gasterosteus aculeatus aculeatus TaxID=481459 RepID=A0AAQ4R119_GASAC|nr:zinc finger and BTB domain-containing protein 7B isoform X2 [Gasterosteus aculeatus aculeatus]
MDAARHAMPRLRLTVPMPMKTEKVAMSPGEDGLIGIPFPEHSNELLSHLNDQRRTGLLCDLTLTSRGQHYLTHRSVMAAVSVYFRGLFAGEEGGCEGGGGFSVCQLDCVAPAALKALLEFAYTATLTIPSSAMRDVLRGAQLLGIKCVADACKDILGETGETAEEQRGHNAATERTAVGGERVAERGSRRKMDKKKMRKVSSHHVDPSVFNPPPASPASHPPPSPESLRSLPPTRPPSPEQEELRVTPHQNGDPRGVRKPGKRAKLNGGLLHWLHERPRGAPRPPAAPPSIDKLSEDEDTEGFVDDGALMESPPVPSAADEGGAAASAAGGGRKRKSQTPQQCPVCQKIIHGAGKLPRHMRTHTGEKPFQCSACGVRFTRNDKLKIHMRKHTGERPYPCPHCPARFLHSYDLKNHLSLHSGARPFECPLCHKAFAREDHLQRHRKGHSCLELRTRRPRRGAELGEDERGDESGREQPDPLEASSLQAHSSAFFPHAALDVGSGSRVGPRLMFSGDLERERSFALQALAQLGPHRLAGYPELFLRDLELRGGREEDGEDPGGAAQRDRWAEEGEEEIGVEEEE